MEYTKVTEDEWEKIILKSENAYFFHSPIWAKILEKTYNYRTATRLYDINGKEILIPMMERNIYGFKTYDSVPGGNDTGGIFSESNITTDDLKLLVEDIIGGRNLSFHLALPPFVNIVSNGKSAAKINEEWKFKDKSNYIHLLNLEGRDFEQIWKNYERRTRGSIRKAIKSGVNIIEGISNDDFRTFYDIWSNASQKWGYEMPPIPFKLWRNLHKYGSEYVKLNLAIKEDKIIAGIITFNYAKTVYAWFSAFIPEYGTFNPTRLLINESIKQACQEGYKYFNFGPSVSNKSLISFKEGFGAKRVEVNRYRIYSNLAKIMNAINSLRAW